MVLEDRIVHDWRGFSWLEMLALSAVASAVVIALGLLTMRRQVARAAQEYAAGAPAADHPAADQVVAKTTKSDGRMGDRTAAAPADESAPTLPA